MPLLKPDWDHGPSDARKRLVPIGAELVRMGKSAYPGNSYNPNVVSPNTSSRRGRFSGTRKDPFGSIYAATNMVDERVVILEMLEHRDMVHNPHGSYFYCAPALVADLSFYYLRVTAPLVLVQLTSEPDANAFGADEDTVYSNSYWYTREWARYIRRRVPDAKGIEFCPKRYRDTRYGTAMVLFEDRIPTDCLELVGSAIPATSDEGRDIFLRCSDYTRVIPSW